MAYLHIVVLLYDFYLKMLGPPLTHVYKMNINAAVYLFEMYYFI